jgi:hypothetical protein
MTETQKPPEGFETWMDVCIADLHSRHGTVFGHTGGSWDTRKRECAEYAAAELAALRAERDAAQMRNECQVCWCDGKHTPATVCYGHYNQALASVNAQDDEADALRAERDRLREALEMAREYVPAVFVAWHEAVQQELAK